MMAHETLLVQRPFLALLNHYVYTFDPTDLFNKVSETSLDDINSVLLSYQIMSKTLLCVSYIHKCQDWNQRVCQQINWGGGTYLHAPHVTLSLGCPHNSIWAVAH